MADDSVLFSLDADGEGTISVLDEIDAALSALSDSIAAVAEGAGELSAIDDALSTVADGADVAASSTDLLMEAISTLSEQVGTLSGSVDSLAGSMDTLAASNDAAAAAADTAGASLDTMGASADAASGAMDALEGAMGPLMMVGMVAAMAGGKLVSMGMDGQKGEALLRGMAGASQADINQLQQSAEDLGVGMDAASQGFYQVESAGYAGKDAISVFTAATKLAEGGQASESDVLSSLTAVMHDYNAKVSDATSYTDLMGMAVLRGKQSMSDFASSIGPLASAGENVGISFKEVAASEATMTQINPHVRQDAQQLTSLFKTLSPTMGTVTASAKKLGLGFDAAHYSSLDLLDKLEYLSKLAGGTNTAAFAKLTGGVQGSTAAIDLLKNGAGAFKGNLEAMGHAAGTTANAFAQFENTVPAHLDKAGAAISIFSTKLMDALGPKLIPVIDRVTSAISTMADFLISHGDVLNAVLAGLAAVIGGILVAAMVAFVAASWPVILVILAVAAAVTGIVLLIEHWSQIMAGLGRAMQLPIIHQLVEALQQAGDYIASLFLPIWHQLVALWETELLPSLKQMWTAIQPVITVLEVVGAIIGGMVLVSFGLLVALISGVIKAFANMLSGFVTFVGGVIKLFTGLVEVVGGIVGLIVDICTGHFSKLGADLAKIWQGVETMFSGIWQMIQGAFEAGIGVIVGLVSGFVDGIKGYFTTLFDDLVGHSIVPDMINGIVQWFEQMPGRAMSAVLSLVSQITNSLGSLGSKAMGWAGDMISGFVQGIENGVGAIGSAISNIAGVISSHLHFSLPEEGPLHDADKWMPDMIDLFVQKIGEHQGKLKTAMAGMASQMTQGISAPGGSIAPGGGTGVLAPLGGGASSGILAGILAAIQSQNKPSAPAQPPGITMYNTNSLYGVQNIQDMYNSLNTMSGYAYENGARGQF